MLKCKDFVEQSSALLANELSWRQRLAMRMHWFMCHHCRRFLRQLGLLLGATAHMHGEASDAEVATVMTQLQPSTDDQASHEPLPPSSRH